MSINRTDDFKISEYQHFFRTWHGHCRTHGSKDWGRGAGWWRSVCKQLMRPVCLGKRVLRRQESLGSRAVPLAFGVLLEGIGHRDGPVAKVLAVHGLDGGVGRVKAGEINKSVALGVSRVRISHDLGCLEDHAKGAERVVEELLVDLGVEIADKDVCAHIQILVVRGRLIHSDWLTIKLYHIHDFDGIICIFFTKELHKAIS